MAKKLVEDLGNTSDLDADDDLESDTVTILHDEDKSRHIGPENASDVPLFAGSEYRTTTSIAKLRVTKLDEPGRGYKGEVPISSTLETIANIHGNGTYNIEAFNSRNRMLHRLENQTINLTKPAESVRPDSQPANMQPLSARELDRVERLAKESGERATAQAKDFTTLVTTTMQGAAERERSFMQGVQRNQQEFFANIMTAQQSGFAQVMAMMTQGHRQTMELTMALSAAGKGEDKSEKMMAMLIQGLNMGRELSGGYDDSDDEETPLWKTIVEGGAHLLTGVQQRQLASENDAEETEEPPPTHRGKAKKPSTANKVKSEVRDLVKIAHALRQRGIAPRQALSMLESGVLPLPRNQASESAHETPNDSDETDDDSDADTKPASRVKRPTFFSEPDTGPHTE